MFTFRLENNFKCILADLELRGQIAKDIIGMPLDDSSIMDFQARPLPRRATSDSAGYDISIPYTVTIPAHATREVFVGISYFVDYPEKVKTVETFQEIRQLVEAEEIDLNQLPLAMVTARSSLLKRKGLTLLNPEKTYNPGALLFVELHNNTGDSVTLDKDENFAQIIFRTTRKFTPSFMGKIEPVKEHEEEFGEVVPSDDGFIYFQSLEDITILPGSIGFATTNLKAFIIQGHYLHLQINPILESMFGVILANGVGIVDADYYGNPSNDGNIIFLLFNKGYAPVSIPKGTVLGRGNTTKYLTPSNDESCDSTRIGGFGSTGI